MVVKKTKNILRKDKTIYNKKKIMIKKFNKSRKQFNTKILLKGGSRKQRKSKKNSKTEHRKKEYEALPKGNITMQKILFNRLKDMKPEILNEITKIYTTHPTDEYEKYRQIKQALKKSRTIQEKPNIKTLALALTFSNIHKQPTTQQTTLPRQTFGLIHHLLKEPNSGQNIYENISNMKNSRQNIYESIDNMVEPNQKLAGSPSKNNVNNIYDTPSIEHPYANFADLANLEGNYNTFPTLTPPQLPPPNIKTKPNLSFGLPFTNNMGNSLVNSDGYLIPKINNSNPYYGF